MANIGSKYRTMQEIVYETMKERILKGEYAQGQRLITNDLANELGVSRMPIREALQRLEAATGLVTLIPHKGAMVNVSSDEDLDEVFQIRAVLEGLAARLAFSNMNQSEVESLEVINQKIVELEHQEDEEYFQELNLEFHTIIWDAAQSLRLKGILKSLYEASRSYRYISLKIPGRLEAVVHEHEEIIAGFRKGDAILVEKIVNKHYQNTIEWLRRAKKEKNTVKILE